MIASTYGAYFTHLFPMPCSEFLILRPPILQGGVRDVYADFNQLTLEITLEALFGFTAGEVEDPPPSPGSGRSGSARESRGQQQAAEIVRAVERAFEFFTKRAGSAMVLPEWVPTLDNIEFGLAVQQLDKVRRSSHPGDPY